MEAAPQFEIELVEIELEETRIAGSEVDGKQMKEQAE